MADEVLVKVEGVSKKFCRSLKGSLWYGVKDMAAEVTGGSASQDKLRPGEFWAIDDVSFNLSRGECLGLIGHNGAGKTTLLKLLNGLIKPDRGRIVMRGRVAALIALGAGFNPILTGRENIYVNGSVLGLSTKEIDRKAEEIIDFAEIRDFIDAPVQSYSSGMAVRLGFAIAVKTTPDILLLDEVLAVGDVAFQAKCFNALAEFRDRGTGFILVSHNMHHVARYSDQVLYLKKGKVVHCGRHDLGIEQFLADMHQTDREPVSERTDWSHVYGSGKVVLTGARFRNAGGEMVTTVDAGESVTLEIDYARCAELHEPPVLDVVMRDREGILFQGTNVQSGFRFNSLPPCGQFHVSFQSLPVNADSVEFFFSLLDPRTSETFDWKRHVRLGISRREAQLGRILLPVRWSCEPS